MIIRFACVEDVPGMIRLLRQVGLVHHCVRPDIFRGDAQKYSEDALLALLQDESRPIFIAEEKGALLGYCFCIRKDIQSDPVLTQRKELYIDDLCVDEENRGSRVGQALYNHACAYAKDLGCRFVTLNVWCGNDSAMAFYEKQGMTPRSITMEKELC